MSLEIYVNTGTEDTELEDSSAEFAKIAVDSDYIIPSAGSLVVADGESIPSQSDFIQAGTKVSNSEDVEVDKFFLADVSDGILKQIHNAGSQNKRYVFAFDFDEATASEPVLEIWDDEDINSVDLNCLGAGTPANSWWKGIVTTDGLPGADWAGTALAGDSSGRFLWLNNENGALTSPQTLYCNLKIVIPAGAGVSGLEEPLLVVKYATN